MDIARAMSARRLLGWQSALTRPRRSWVCQPCRSHIGPASRRFFSDQSPTSTPTATTSASSPMPPPPADKPYYITTPIFYVNAAPHIGHMYTMLLADVFKRWQTLLGKRAILCTGTDEHGMKVQQAAALAGIDPKQFCDQNAGKFSELAQLARMDYDRFIRTTDPDHVQAVEHFWFLLRERGFIYESKHEGWYSVSDECFYPESQLVRTQDPHTGTVFMASAETGSKVEWVEEKNLCFRMSALKDRLLEFYKNNPGWIEPAHRMNEVTDWVKNHLEDLSISRPIQRLSWGIRVPDDPGQTIYVWVDALINYITAAGFPNWPPGEGHKGGWPVDVQVIGKDILRFHCIYWPALLMALDLPLPRKMLVHAHWTLSNRKMSKSIGNVVNPLFAINRWGIDTIRFYLLSEGGIADDADYSNDLIAIKYKKSLQGGFGNLVGRLVRSNLWDTRKIVEDAFYPRLGVVKPDGVFEEYPVHFEVQDALKKLEASLAEVAPTVAKLMEAHNPVGAIRKVLEISTMLNEILSRIEPWSLVKTRDFSDKVTAHKTLFMVGEGLRIGGILLQPFLPDKSTELLDLLGVAHDKRGFANAVMRSDQDYGRPMRDPGIGAAQALFPPLVEDVKIDYGGTPRTREKNKRRARFPGSE